jgi:hypothetical protein
MAINPETIEALKNLRQHLPRVAEALDVDLGEGFPHWHRTLDRKLLPRLQHDMPLVAAICGGGSTGKSTLFNALIGQPVSPVGGRAGLNRRVLVATQKMAYHPSGILDYLGHNFESVPGPLENQEQLLSPGPPLYFENDTVPQRVVLLDTPDIDTGAKGQYTNRALARQCLEVADVFIYIFTNATYNNLDNTDFITRMLTGMGKRPCYLIYRVYPGFTGAEVREHALTVERNIYGTSDSGHVLGIYRADEDNAVAAGERPMQLRPVEDTRPALGAALAHLDPAPIRARLLETMFEDAMDQARQMTRQIHGAQSHLNQYVRALEITQERCVQKALSHFPTDRVLRRFARIWLESDPAHIKFMRNTGKVIEWPLKTVIKTVQRFKGADPMKKPPSSEETLARQLEMDLLTAANQLYQKSIGPDLSVNSQSVSTPAVARAAQARLGQKLWETTLQTIADQKDEVLSWSTQLDSDLKLLADQLRRRMGIMDQIRQTFAAMLNVIPATAAITYILHTGDPVGAAGIKVKLTGLFGLHDLYALIAIPATAGMSGADRRQLEQMLGPLAKTWLEHKFKVVDELFEAQISGEVLNTVREAKTRSEDLVQQIDQALAKVNV